MKYILPFNKDNYNYKYNIVLEGSRYYFTIQRNSRMDKWLLSIANYKQEPILTGLPLLIGSDLIRRFVNSEKPPGYLFFCNSTNENLDITRDNASDDYMLIYVTSDDEDYLEYLNG